MQDGQGPPAPKGGTAIGKLKLMQITRRHLESVTVDKGSHTTEDLASTSPTQGTVDPAVYGESGGPKPKPTRKPERAHAHKKCAKTRLLLINLTPLADAKLISEEEEAFMYTYTSPPKLIDSL